MVKRGMSRKLYSKSQYAMELLMTYGWALILISIVLGALFYFNIFSVADMKPDVCRLSPGLVCEEVVVHPNNFSIRITNSMGADVDLIIWKKEGMPPTIKERINLASLDILGDPCQDGDLGVGSEEILTIPNGASITFNESCYGYIAPNQLFTPGHKQNFNFNFKYRIFGEIFDVQGKIFTYVAK